MNYPANLCTLPKEEQQAIEQDKQDWFFVYRQFNALNQQEMQGWLNQQKQISPDTHQGYLKKANILFANQQKKLESSTLTMQQGLKDAKSKRVIS